jgi:hypothetical protein
MGSYMSKYMAKFYRMPGAVRVHGAVCESRDLAALDLFYRFPGAVRVITHETFFDAGTGWSVEGYDTVFHDRRDYEDKIPKRSIWKRLGLT